MKALKKLRVIIIFINIIIFSVSLSADKNSIAINDKQLIDIVKREYPNLKINDKHIFTADINCDGYKDYALYGQVNNFVKVVVIHGPIVNKNIFDTLKIRFGFSGYQDVVPGKKFYFSLESLDFDIEAAIGEVEGFQRSKVCKGLNISDGMTDSFHIYYDHKMKQLVWWRL